MQSWFPRGVETVLLKGGSDDFEIVAEGDVVLDAAAIDFSRRSDAALWERVATVLDQDRMPPPEWARPI